jgi:hypothetical protein
MLLLLLLLLMMMEVTPTQSSVALVPIMLLLSLTVTSVASPPSLVMTQRSPFAVQPQSWRHTGQWLVLLWSLLVHWCSMVCRCRR